ncbi:non-specific lipid-transfer protein P3-like [Aegilops tauschii subsp. strangulata]|nr:non-specific lipid-transfer protein P3-like [Aegilops tauschii subsp. strangulata]
MTPTHHSPAVVAVALLVAVLAAEAGGDESDCSVAQTAFSECTGYLAGLDDEVPPQCCRGLGDVKDLAPGADQRRDLCACILSEMLAVGKVDSGRAAGLPSACGLSVGFLPTSPDFDCSLIP